MVKAEITFPMLWPCSCSLTSNSMSTLEGPGEGRTSSPVGGQEVSCRSWAGKAKAPPRQLHPFSPLWWHLLNTPRIQNLVITPLPGEKSELHGRRRQTRSHQLLAGWWHAPRPAPTARAGHSTSLSCTGCCSLPSYHPPLCLHSPHPAPSLFASRVANGSYFLFLNHQIES